MNQIDTADELGIDIRLAGSQAKLAVNGRVTVDSSPRLRSALLKLIRSNRGMVLAIDLSGVPYMDTSGVATLVEALKAAHDRSVKLHLEGVNGQPRMLMQTIEMDHIFRKSGSEMDLQ